MPFVPGNPNVPSTPSVPQPPTIPGTAGGLAAVHDDGGWLIDDEGYETILSGPDCKPECTCTDHRCCRFTFGQWRCENRDPANCQAAGGYYAGVGTCVGFSCTPQCPQGDCATCQSSWLITANNVRFSYVIPDEINGDCPVVITLTGSVIARSAWPNGPACGAIDGDPTGPQFHWTREMDCAWGSNSEGDRNLDGGFESAVICIGGPPRFRIYTFLTDGGSAWVKAYAPSFSHCPTLGTYPATEAGLNCPTCYNLVVSGSFTVS